jgi:alpha-tubulin suppressor-like RCC1 family protein
MKSRIVIIILSVVLFTQISFAQLCVSLKDVAAGEYHTLALGEDGSLWSCGGRYDCYKQLGLGDGVYYNILSLRPVLGLNGDGLLKNIIAFDAGMEHSLAVD